MIRGSVSGPEHEAIFRAICKSPTLSGIPTKLGLDGSRSPTSEDWRERLLSGVGRRSAFWKDSQHKTLAGLSYLPASDLVHFDLPINGNIDHQISTVDGWPFELAALVSPHEESWIASEKQRWGFSRSHVPHGWACAFRGAGHDRLVSRRWLEFGPWRVIRRPDDTTFIQFHDLSLTDPDEAYAQAAPGHQRMGIDAIGGFIQRIDEDDISTLAKRCVFQTDTKKLELPIAPRIDVSQEEMRVACSLRLWSHHREPPEKRIEHLAFVFMDKADAHRHLHELWLREIECWYMDETGKHRIDTDYHATPTPPDWVRLLDAAG